MPDAARAELLRALGRTVRGLSVLFWGLAWTGLVYMELVYMEAGQLMWRESFSLAVFVPAFLVSPFLWHGVNHLRAFQPQERIWQRALCRAEGLAVLDAGLAPFLYWWRQLPAVPLYIACVILLSFSSVLLLVQINCVLRRLCAMLPDEALRADTKLYTHFNISVLSAMLAGLALYFLLTCLPVLPGWLVLWVDAATATGIWLALFLVLMPLTLTMALVWKIKEVIFASLTGAG
jgi:hypothetical protein